MLESKTPSPLCGVTGTVALCVLPFVIVAVLRVAEFVWLEMNPGAAFVATRNDAGFVENTLAPFLFWCALGEFLAVIWALVNSLLVRRLVFAFRMSNAILNAVVPLLLGTLYLCVTMATMAYILMTHLV